MKTGELKDWGVLFYGDHFSDEMTAKRKEIAHFFATSEEDKLFLDAGEEIRFYGCVYNDERFRNGEKVTVSCIKFIEAREADTPMPLLSNIVRKLDDIIILRKKFFYIHAENDIEYLLKPSEINRTNKLLFANYLNL